MTTRHSCSILPVALFMAAALQVSPAPAQEEEQAKVPVLGELLKIGSGESSDVEITTHTTTTVDGWDLSLKRYLRKSQGQGSPKPRATVILCHGFNINNLFWDIHESCSLARFLSHHGYDVWAPSLRGSGESSKPLLSKVRDILKLDPGNIPKVVTGTSSDITRTDWTIDDHIHQDVPAIIDFVSEESGFDTVYWIGHSMGGIVMFGYLETSGQKKIAGFIPLGSMMVLPEPLTPILQTIADQKEILTASLVINTTVASQLSNFTLGTVRTPVEKALLERQNVDPLVLFQFFRTCIDDTSRGVVGQFTDSIRSGEIQSHDQEYSYTDNLDRVTVPILFMAGGSDGFVTEDMLRQSYNAVSSEDKELRIFSKETGYSMDYGHCDLIIGKNSAKDLYPAILDWLDKRARQDGA